MAKDFPYSIQIDSHRRFSIIRFPNETQILTQLIQFGATIPAAEFYSLTRTANEISVIQDAKYPAYPLELGEKLAQRIETQEGYVLLEVVPDTGSQIDFGVTGLLARLAGILAKQRVPIFAISTFDTDHILIKAENLGKAGKALERDGIVVNIKSGEAK